MLTELITLLTCEGLTGKELADSVSRIHASPADPELDWIEGQSTGEYMQFAVLAELGDYFATGEHIEQVHEEISELFAQPLPAFPHEMDTAAYFQWLDAQLAARATPYEALVWGNFFDDNLYVFIVRRNDTARVLELATQLELVVAPATPR